LIAPSPKVPEQRLALVGTPVIAYNELHQSIDELIPV
jgi:hypothetical protein